LGIGGGIITKKLLFTVLLIASLSLSGIACASAAYNGTVQTLNNNTTTVQEIVNTQDKSINGVKESTTKQKPTHKNVKTNQSDITTQVNDKGTTQTTADTTKGSINNSQAQPITNDLSTNTNSSTENSESTQKLQAAAGDINTVSVNQIAAIPTSFTLNQIKDAAARVKSFVETNHALPNYVTIGTTQVKMPDFLKLLTAGLLQINSGTNNPIVLKSFTAPTSPRDSIVAGNILKSEYLKIANDINNYMNSSGKTPDFAYKTSLGTYLGYQNLVYIYSKILNFQKTNNYLPTYVTVNAWSTIANSVLAQTRPVYITSDNINGVTADMNRINAIVNGLKALGLTAINWGLGPNTHNTVLQSSQVPSNALVVDIYGGACAGTIYEMGLSYYKKLVASKKVFCVWIPPATNITGLAWLPRSHDDTFSPSSFTGLAHPDQYLLNNGYHYIYSGDLNTIIASIYKEATTV
jgi:hypothetical protein